MNVHCFQQISRSIEKSWRIVIAGDDNGMPARCGGKTREKSVIQLLRPIAGSAGIKNIPRHDQGINMFFPNRIDQPVEESRRS